PETGAPILSDLPGWLELKVVQIFQPGDHTLYLTQVVGAEMRDASATPLLLPETGWSYGG
ncbi:MAG TPA: flavin reductase, partial [Chloroflexota bacterium]|nr:flavin reductase [Chloroflexota bacterium]